MSELNDLAAQLREAKQAVINTDLMWRGAITIVLAGDIELIGKPGQPNSVREHLRPVAELVAAQKEMS